MGYDEHLVWLQAWPKVDKHTMECWLAALHSPCSCQSGPASKHHTLAPRSRNLANPYPPFSVTHRIAAGTLQPSTCTKVSPPPAPPLTPPCCSPCFCPCCPCRCWSTCRTSSQGKPPSRSCCSRPDSEGGPSSDGSSWSGLGFGCAFPRAGVSSQCERSCNCNQQHWVEDGEGGG